MKERNYDRRFLDLSAWNGLCQQRPGKQGEREGNDGK